MQELKHSPSMSTLHAPALAHLAPLFDGREPVVAPEHVGQRRAHVDHGLGLFAVDGAAHQFILRLVHQIFPPESRMDSRSARFASSSTSWSRNSRLARQLVRGFTSMSAALPNASTVASSTGLPRTAASADGARMGTGPATP